MIEFILKFKMCILILLLTLAIIVLIFIGYTCEAIAFIYVMLLAFICSLLSIVLFISLFYMNYKDDK